MNQDTSKFVNTFAPWFSALGTLAAVCIAIWGVWIRARLFKPWLHLSLHNPHGELVQVSVTVQQNNESVKREIKTRYYHLKLRNEVRLSPASQAQILIVSLEEAGPDGLPQVVFNAPELPLRWRYQEFNPATSRTIGPKNMRICCMSQRTTFLI
jgi:hypothetical protein